MNYLNSTIIAEATENHISNHSRMYSEKSLEFEKHSEIIDDNMQEFINDSHKTSYEQEMYLEGSGLNSEFKMNLLIFYLAFSMVLIVKVLASAGLYISNEISEVYAWVNIGGTFLVFALAFILLIGVLCSDLMKSYIRPAYIALFSFILIFFSMCDSGNLHKFLGSSSTQTIDYSNSMYILVMLLFMKDLLFDSFIATLILGIFTIISPLVAFLATSRTDFNYFLSGHIVLTVMAIYLIVCSSRRDKKQKIFFKGRYEQKRIVDWTDKTHDTPHAKTRREKVIRIANSTIGLLQKVNPVILSAQLQKEIEKGLNSLQTMKGNLLEWPAHREKTISRCFFPGNEGLMFEENLNDYYYQILSLKNLKIFGIEENLRDMIKDWNFDVFTLKLEKSFFRCARYLCVDYTRVFEDLALPYQEFENFFCRLESVIFK